MNSGFPLQQTSKCLAERTIARRLAGAADYKDFGRMSRPRIANAIGAGNRS
jgi:hypothetical protein